MYSVLSVQRCNVKEWKIKEHKDRCEVETLLFDQAIATEHDYSVMVLLNDVIFRQSINNASCSRCTLRGGGKCQTDGT